MKNTRQASSLLFIFCQIMCTISFGNNDVGEQRTLSRRKRYVVFPEGSSFSIALCMTVHTLTPDNIFTEGLNWGISYDLPNESKPALEPLLELRKDPVNKPTTYHQQNLPNTLHYSKNPSNWNYDNKPYKRPYIGGKKYYKPDYNYIRRRHRRELYNKLEIIMNAMGFEGRSCVLRALCEASQRLMPKGNTLVEEMMRIAFTLPLKRVLSYEPEEHRTYTDAHRAGHQGQNCATSYPGCTFSLIDMALGKYNSDDSISERPSADLTSYNTNSPAIRKKQQHLVTQETLDGTSKTSTLVRYNMK